MNYEGGIIYKCKWFLLFCIFVLYPTNMKNLYSTLLLSIISIFTFGQVTIQTNLPASIAPNSNLNIEVKINKGSIANFSKYQMDVPAGVNVSEGNSKTGNFSFE